MPFFKKPRLHVHTHSEIGSECSFVHTYMSWCLLNYFIFAGSFLDSYTAKYLYKQVEKSYLWNEVGYRDGWSWVTIEKTNCFLKHTIQLTVVWTKSANKHCEENRCVVIGYPTLHPSSLTLGAHARRGLRYFVCVCVSVRPPICYHYSATPGY